MDHLKEIVLEYVTTESFNSHALMITGDWGSGKTHYIKNTIKNEIEKTGKTVLYVSLNGLRSSSEIFNELIAERFSGIKLIKENKIGKIAFGALKSAAAIGVNALKIVTGFKGIEEVDPKASDLPSVTFQELISFSKDNHVLCFDDLERVSQDFDIADVLGFINSNFVEHEGVKVLIICNEKEIISKGSSAAENEYSKQERRYYRIKEKVVGRTIQFEPRLKETILAFFESFCKLDAGFYHFLKSNEEFLIQKILASKEKNLRTILFMLKSLWEVFKRTQKEIIERFQKEIILATIVFSIEEKRGNFQRHKNLKQILSRLGSPSDNSLVGLKFKDIVPVAIDDENQGGDYLNEGSDSEAEKALVEEKALIERIVKEYIQSDQFLFISPIHQYIVDGFLDDELLASELRSLIPEDQPAHIKTLSEIQKSYNLNDSVFSEEFPKLMNYIEGGYYSLPEFIEAAKVLHDLSLNEVIKEYPKDVLNVFLLKNIKKVLNNVNPDDIERADWAMGHRTPQFDQSEDLLEAIEQIKKEIRENKKEEIAKQNLEKIKDEDYLELEVEAIRDIFRYLNPEDIQEVVAKKLNPSPRRVLLIISLLDDAYSIKTGAINRVFANEAENLSNLYHWAREYRESIETGKAPIRDYWIRVLEYRLLKIVEKIEIC